MYRAQHRKLVTALLLVVAGCSANDDAPYWGYLSGGKGESFGALTDVPFEIPGRQGANQPGLSPVIEATPDSSFKFVISQNTSFKLQVKYEGVVTGSSPKAKQLTHEVQISGEGLIRITIMNWGTDTATGVYSLIPTESGGGGGGNGGGGGGSNLTVEEAARENLRRIAKEIDPYHLGVYKLDGPIEEQFIKALEIEYADHPDQLAVRKQVLASAIFFAAPEIMPPANGGKVTPFHGMDMDDFGTLMDIHDKVFMYLVNTKNNGRLAGVRPFSVCETKYQIEKYVKGDKEYDGFDSYRDGYAVYAQSCPPEDLLQWYNFRGLGHMRPTWMEANIMERFVRNMVKKCDVPESPSSDWVDECNDWNAGRLAYRIDRNRQLASRFMFYHPDQENYFDSPSNPALLVQDRNGDGIAEYLINGEGALKDGTEGTVSIQSTGEFSGRLSFRPEGGTSKSTYVSKMAVETEIDPEFDPSWLQQPDYGLMTRFSDPAECNVERPEPATCPLLKRFYVMIDRHESFYNTYTALSRTSYLSSQPSPLVACSITLRQSHHWDSAGTPSGGRAGFIYLFRVPFAEIVAGERTSVSTLDPGPEVMAIQDLYDGTKKLDMSRAWIDIASLSNNLYSSEHEVSKFAIVPADEIEGLLVIRKPKAMDNN